jgi:hypothetical protein
MKARRRAVRISLAGVLVLALSAAFSAPGAGAAVWEFNGTPLVGNETILSSAVTATIAFPGMTTTCEMDYDITIWNVPAGGSAKGSATGLSFSNCHTDSQSCTVASIQALSLPWVADPVNVGGSIYLVIKGVRIDVLYEGEECVLAETPFEITGSAGGLINNAIESIVFNSSSFAATGTKLSGLKTTIQLQGSFAMQATGAHSGQSIAVL